MLCAKGMLGGYQAVGRHTNMLTCVRRGCPVTHAAAGRKGGLTPSSWTWSWVESTLSQHISKQVGRHLHVSQISLCLHHSLE